jgi:hypothetical protein
MGYFSNLAAEYVPYDNDHSYTAPDRQLLWRLEELEERLHELTTQKTGKRDEGVCFSEENLRYVLPEHFLSASDVRKAIDLAIDDLRDRYGICVREEECAEDEPVVDEVTDMQITFLDILSLQSQSVPLSAA